MKPKVKYHSVDDAITKLEGYCSYHDRCHSEVRSKLLSINIYGDDLEEIITHLIEHKYLDEERYARAYARGKFRINKWGKIKIKLALKQKQVSAYCIKKGMSEIQDEEYILTIEQLLEKKLANSPLDYKHKQKAIRWAMGKGYEIQVILDAMESISEV